MNRTQYRQARRLVRDNGRFALRWLPADQAAVMEAVTAKTNDLLAERADIVGYCRREGLNCNPRLTGRL